MIKRFFWFGLIALAFSLPILLNRGDSPQQAARQYPPLPNPLPWTGNSAVSANYLSAVPSINAGYSPYPGPAGSGRGLAVPSATAESAALSAATPYVQSQPPVYNAFANPAEYLNFYVTPDWVRARWERISMTPGEDQLTGMRVALVSGPRPADIQGSLTYYFDSARQLQRITFRGWTGEPAELVQFLTTNQGLTKRSSQSAGFYKKTRWGNLQSFLRLDYPPVLLRDSSNEQLMVLLEINNPSGSLSVSQQNADILAAMGE